MMKSIRLNLSKSNDDLYMKSKWFGNPDVPENYPIPDDLCFICQIRCDELAKFDEDNVLPHKGMLYFFGAVDYYFGWLDCYYPENQYWQRDDIKVFYIEDIENQEFKQIVFEDEDGEPLAIAPRSIEFSLEKSECDGHKLLGVPFDMPWEDWDAPYHGWVELLQVDSDEDDDFCLNFVDFGMMHVLIDPNDLENKDFSKVTATLIYT